MQKTATDKVNITECHPKSTLITINFFPKSYSVYYYALTMELEKNLWSGSVYIKLSTKENIVILNVILKFFCVQTKVFGKIKFCCLIITPFVS